MPSICLILKAHEPYRLKHYSFFDIGASPVYSDEATTLAQLNKVAQQCYLPTTRLLQKLITEYTGEFRFSIVLSGIAIDQLERFQPEVLTQFRKLADTGCVEFIGEPYFHSLSFLFSKPEFRQQLDLHRQKLKALFDQDVSTVYDHATNYNNDLALEANAMEFKTILASGADRILDDRSVNRVYQPAPCPGLKLLFDNPLLADFTCRTAPPAASTKPGSLPAQFMTRLTHLQGDLITLPIDLHTFTESQTSEAGALEFLSQLPGTLLTSKDFTFETPSQRHISHPPCGSVTVPGFTSWENSERESHEWMGNEMQKDAIQGLYLLEQEAKSHPDPAILRTWRYLQDSNHFRYMNTKPRTEVTDHADVDPYHSPYDAYINYMNVLTDFSERLTTRKCLG